jgi:hypothetical protein
VTVAVPDTARCLHCGYALRGLPEAVCPECGNAFDPERPETFKDPDGPPRRRARGIPRAPTHVYLVVIASITALFLVRCSHVSGAIEFRRSLCEWTCLAPLDTAVLLGFPAIDCFLQASRARRCRKQKRDDLLREYEQGRTRRRILIVVLVPFYLTIFLPQWPAAPRFYAAWPWLAPEADRFLVDPNADFGPRRIGPVYVEYIWGRGQGFVWFRTYGSYGYVRVDRWGTGKNGGRLWVAPGWYLGKW